MCKFLIDLGGLFYINFFFISQAVFYSNVLQDAEDIPFLSEAKRLRRT